MKKLSRMLALATMAALAATSFASEIQKSKTAIYSPPQTVTATDQGTTSPTPSTMTAKADNYAGVRDMKIFDIGKPQAGADNLRMVKPERMGDLQAAIDIGGSPGEMVRTNAIGGGSNAIMMMGGKFDFGSGQHAIDRVTRAGYWDKGPAIGASPGGSQDGEFVATVVDRRVGDLGSSATFVGMRHRF